MKEASERIRRLLDRVGYHPVRFKNNEESKELHRDHLIQIIEDEYAGDAYEMIDDLTETVNDLECALENMANRYMQKVENSDAKG